MATPVFNKYEIIRRLAVGGMGEIFLARQTGVAGFDRLVILKSLLPHLAAQAKFVRQFLDEARVAARLSHPNIVAIYEVGLWEGTYFIAMEYIHGVTLSKMIKQAVEARAVVPVEIIARIMHDAAVALDNAHHATGADGAPLNIVHRDVSPQNIMVRADGITKVVDFGIAKAAIVAGQTATGELKGKLRYMPPEQLTGQTMDGRSDQFALGVCFWEFCTRRHLFTADNPAQLLREVALGPIPSPAPFMPSLPSELAAVMMRMLDRDPDQRFPSLRDVSNALREYLRALPQAVGEPEVAQYVQGKLGEEIDAVTADLTPDSADNFVISLRTPTETGTPVVSYLETEESATQPMPGGPAQAIAARRRRWVGLASLGLIVGLAAVLALSWLRSSAGQGAELGSVTALDATVAASVDAASPPPAQPRPPPAPEAPPTLSLTSTPRGAEVLLGEQVLGATPLETKALPPDVTHVLTLRKKGYRDATLQVRLGAGEARSQRVELRRGPAGRPPRPTTVPPAGVVATKTSGEKGALTIKTTPWTEVEIDGAPRGTTPLFKLPIAPGEHTVRLVNKGKGVQRVQKVRIKPGELFKLDLDLTK